jgi:hypothetical protein
VASYPTERVILAGKGDLDMSIDDQNVVRPDVFVLDAEAYDPDRVSAAADVVLAVEVVSSGSKLHDRRVKPELYRNARVPFWRIERSDRRLFLVDKPVFGEEQTHFGTAALRVADINVVVDLDAIAAIALGKPQN